MLVTDKAEGSVAELHRGIYFDAVLPVTAAYR